MFKAEPVEESFFSSAPFLMKDTFAIAKPAAEVWAELTEDNPLSWCRAIGSIEWTSERPFDVGTTRTVFAAGGLSIYNERFFIWEEGSRKSFYVIEARLPGFKSFAEDYLVEPTGERSCRFTWTLAGELQGIARFGEGGNRALLGTLFKDTRKHYGAP
ncbi:MAG TPA: SRPBCC family protein [Solirubrobacteraceae bacterium]|nr:SRPBCC family protein [Solirubrobacteraceae bacterium]